MHQLTWEALMSSTPIERTHPTLQAITSDDRIGAYEDYIDSID